MQPYKNLPNFVKCINTKFKKCLFQLILVSFISCTTLSPLNALDRGESGETRGQGRNTIFPQADVFWTLWHFFLRYLDLTSFASDNLGKVADPTFTMCGSSITGVCGRCRRDWRLEVSVSCKIMLMIGLWMDYTHHSM